MADYYFEGIKENEFISIDSELKKKLVILIARIAEMSYRRGAQQAFSLGENISEEIRENFGEWRFHKCLDTAPGLTGFDTTSIDRLMVEIDLSEVGLCSNRFAI